jgi:hypothetical protein
MKSLNFHKVILITIFFFGMVAICIPIRAQSSCQAQYNSCIATIQKEVNSCVSQAQTAYNPQSNCEQYQGFGGDS